MIDLRFEQMCRMLREAGRLKGETMVFSTQYREEVGQYVLEQAWYDAERYAVLTRDGHVVLKQYESFYRQEDNKSEVDEERMAEAFEYFKNTFES